MRGSKLHSLGARRIFKLPFPAVAPLLTLFYPPVEARHAFWSAAASLDDQDPQPTERLIQTALRACELAHTIDLSSIAKRAEQPERGWINQWPGEHYRFLAGLVEAVRPSLAVEVGTFTGLGSLSLVSQMPKGGQVITYDIVSWQRFPRTLLLESDFAEQLEQRVGDLSDLSFFRAQREALKSSQIIFIDGPKDGRFEPAFLDFLLPELSGTGAIIVMDDIRLLKMLQLWRDLPIPKLDITSFAHWTGTGIAEVP